MAEFTVEDINVTPYLDMELVMSVSQETRIGGAQMERMVSKWEKWIPELTVKKFKVGKIQYLAAWLGEAVEQDVDEVWGESASEAYLVNTLAQVMVMQAIHSVLPEVEDAGCAPAPKPTDNLVAVMEELGCPYNATAAGLSKRYAVVTHYPFKGACEICYLQEDCPKGSGKSDGGTFVLPGHEQG